MKKNLALTIRDKKVIYLNDKQLVPDAFDWVYEFKGFLIAYNPNKLVIVNSEGKVIVSEDCVLHQVFNYGEYISLRKNNTMGVYRYDGSIAVPFEYYSVSIDYGAFYVRKTNDSKAIVYEQN